MNQKLLVVSWGVHPLPTGSSVIVNNIASGFDKNDMIILGEEPEGIDKNGWSDDLPTIYYINRHINYHQWMCYDR